jgi:asparagine synthetase B (glutamine-hydrolysing)
VSVWLQAFDDVENPYLPAKILWRQKEQFSDGVGYGWIDSLRAVAAKEVSDQMFLNAKNRQAAASGVSGAGGGVDPGALLCPCE